MKRRKVYEDKRFFDGRRWRGCGRSDPDPGGSDRAGADL